MKVSTTSRWAANDRGPAANYQMREHVERVHAAAGLGTDRPGVVRCALTDREVATSRDLADAYGLPCGQVDRVGDSAGTDWYERGDLVFTHPYANEVLRNEVGTVGPRTLARATAVAAYGHDVPVRVAAEARAAMRDRVGAVLAAERAAMRAAVRD